MSHTFHAPLTEIRQDATCRLRWPHSMLWRIFSHARAQAPSCSIPRPMSTNKCRKQFITFVQWLYYTSSPYVNSICLHFSATSRYIISNSLAHFFFFFHTSHLSQDRNTLYDKPTQQPATAANMKAYHCKQFRVNSIQTHMYVPQDYCIVNGTTMISAWITVILLPSRYAIMPAWRHESKSMQLFWYKSH